MGNWNATLIDFDQVHAQADGDTDAYLHLPMGFWISNKDRHIIKMIRNVYGLKQEGYNFYGKLKAELIKRGHIQSEADPCAFYKNNIIVLYYADDWLLFAQDKKLITELLMSS